MYAQGNLLYFFSCFCSGRLHKGQMANCIFSGLLCFNWTINNLSKGRKPTFPLFLPVFFYDSLLRKKKKKQTENTFVILHLGTGQCTAQSSVKPSTQLLPPAKITRRVLGAHGTTTLRWQTADSVPVPCPQALASAAIVKGKPSKWWREHIPPEEGTSPGHQKRREDIFQFSSIVSRKHDQVHDLKSCTFLTNWLRILTAGEAGGRW